MSRRSRALALLAVFAAVVVFSRHTVSMGSSGTTTTSLTPTTTVHTSTSRPVVATTCRVSDFTLDWFQGQGAAGTVYSTVSLHYNAAAPCVINSYPLVTLQDSYGSVLPTVELRVPADRHLYFPDSRANYGPKPLTVNFGQVLHFGVAASDAPIGTLACENVAAISVQLRPGETSRSVSLPYGLTACGGGQVMVSAVY